MKKILHFATGLCWGIAVSNTEIIPYAIFISAITIIIDISVKDE